VALSLLALPTVYPRVRDELRVFAQGAVPGLAEGGDNDVPEPGNEFRVGAL